jgi:hypothetical protein
VTGVWEERAARNEALFREVNEKVEAVSRQFGFHEAAETVAFVCECSDDACMEHLRVPINVYESVRADPRRFILKAGHETEIERVIARNNGYAIVEKQGAAGRIAAETDPRT